jgi:LysM repeat protein
MRKITLIIAVLFALQFLSIANIAAAPAPVEPGETALASAPSAADGVWYTVQRGDSLFSIARKYNSSAYEICISNSLTNCNVIYVGQRLWVPALNQPTPVCTSYHNVVKGETLYSIARAYGLNVYDLAAANKIYNLNLIKVGQRLCIPG